MSPRSASRPSASAASSGHALQGIDGPVLVACLVVLQEVGETSAHCHPRGQLLGCTRGVLSITTPAGAWVVPMGHAIWLPPDEPHSGRSYGPAEGWSLYVAPVACGELPTAPKTVAVPPLLREAVLRCATWNEATLEGARAQLAAVILDEISNLPARALDLPMPRDPRLLRIAQALLRDPACNRGLDAWAMWAGSTARTVTRRFPRETGYSFTTWRQRARLIRALELLTDGQAVTTVAFDLGYDSVSAFIALFRQNFGSTPAAYARDAGKAERVSSPGTW